MSSGIQMPPRRCANHIGNDLVRKSEESRRHGSLQEFSYPLYPKIFIGRAWMLPIIIYIIKNKRIFKVNQIFIDASL